MKKKKKKPQQITGGIGFILPIAKSMKYLLVLLVLLVLANVPAIHDRLDELRVSSRFAIAACHSA